MLWGAGAGDALRIVPTSGRRRMRKIHLPSRGPTKTVDSSNIDRSVYLLQLHSRGCFARVTREPGRSVLPLHPRGSTYRYVSASTRPSRGTVKVAPHDFSIQASCLFLATTTTTQLLSLPGASRGLKEREWPVGVIGCPGWDHPARSGSVCVPQRHRPTRSRRCGTCPAGGRCLR